jgi:hypothetical protein
MRDEAEGGHLPDVCMRCGAQAWSQRSKSFAWCPPWVAILILAGLLPYIIVAIVLTKRMTVRVPLCDEHKSHWSWRAWFVGLGAVLLLVLGVACLVVLAALDNQRKQNFGGSQSNPLGGILCAGTAVAGLVWLFAAAIIQQRAIRPSEITDDSITLVNVAPGFVEAVEQGPGPDAERDNGRRRPQRRDWDEDRYRQEDERRRQPPRGGPDEDRYRE